MLIRKPSLQDKYNAFIKMDSTRKAEFIADRLEKVIKEPSQIDRVDLKSSGSTGKAKNYQWGPHFKEHYDLYNNLFYDGNPFIRLIPYLKEGRPFSDLIQSNDKEVYNLFIGEINPPIQKMRNQFICTNAEITSLIEAKRPFLEHFFDLKSCVFCFTYSPMTPKLRQFFDNRGVNYRDQMRCWDGGATFINCRFGNKHWVDFSSIIRFNEKKLLSTDLWNAANPSDDYWNDDLVNCTRTNVMCECGLSIDHIEFEERPYAFFYKNSVQSYLGLLRIVSGPMNFTHFSVKTDGEKILFLGDLVMKDVNQLKERLIRAKINNEVYYIDSLDIDCEGIRKLRRIIKDDIVDISSAKRIL